jgi:hypothetical protein
MLKQDIRTLPAAVKRAIPEARLPVNYVAARTALLACERIDEVKDWTDKLAAAATYAKQAGDNTMLEMAKRLQLRAADRLGEILKTFSHDPPLTQNGPGKKSESDRAKAARAAGIKARQAHDAVAIASMEATEKGLRIEQPSPPSVSQLAAAARGLIRGPTPCQTDSASWRELIRGPCGLMAFANFAEKHSPAVRFAITFTPGEAWLIRERILKPLTEWLDAFDQSLPKSEAPPSPWRD